MGSYIPAAVLIWRLASTLEESTRPLHIPMLMLVLAGAICHVAGGVILHFVQEFGYGLHWFGLFTPALLLRYLPFFAVGLLLFSNQKAVNELSTLNLTTLMSLLITTRTGSDSCVRVADCTHQVGDDNASDVTG